MDKLKAEYNSVLSRYLKAKKFMENNDIPNSEKEKYLPELEKITCELGRLLLRIGNYSDFEAMNGFDTMVQIGKILANNPIFETEELNNDK